VNRRAFITSLTVVLVLAWFVLIPIFMTTGIPGIVTATPYPELSPLDAAFQADESESTAVAVPRSVCGA